MRLTIILGVICLLNACGGAPQQWQGYCFPRAYLTPDIQSDDSNFDSASNYGPTVFFEGEYIAKQVDSFKGTTADPLFGRVYNHLQIISSTQAIEKQLSEEHSLTQSEEIPSLYFDKQSKYDWYAYTRGDNGYEYWGSCMIDGSGDSKQGYSCMRQLTQNGLSFTYDVDFINLAAYPQIDAFIKRQLTQWRCE
ncbi:hypothetical protein FIU82_04245 [Pseudoalteromonas sp. THAF3]|uniref:hypothetical protein n=1 Tax=Pseudoalteromonas sp. THAF3 TaxID=2587843 RepID=UPI001268584C|nr:hypothetical protein [Pseudoalteromonas sp. THAF3]QFU04229.1 hypothetical protein FIU82_04245 [Pseudoalteromonas sp. THAF3]